MRVEGAARDTLSGKTLAEERSAKLVEERDMLQGEAAARAKELSVVQASLADAERREAAVREAYGDMSTSAYQSMVSLWGGLAKVGVLIDPPNHDRADGPASLAAIDQGLELIHLALAGFAMVNAQTAWRLAFILAYKS